MTPYSFNPMGHDAAGDAPIRPSTHAAILQFLTGGTFTRGGEEDPETAVVTSGAHGSVLTELTAEGPDQAFFCCKGGTLVSCTVLNNGRMFLERGGVASSAGANQNGYIHVFSGGVAYDPIVDEFGTLEVDAGGSALSVTSGSTATIIDNGGYITYK